jgi:hypothetical protein
MAIRIRVPSISMPNPNPPCHPGFAQCHEPYDIATPFALHSLHFIQYITRMRAAQARTQNVQVSPKLRHFSYIINM